MNIKKGDKFTCLLFFMRSLKIYLENLNAPFIPSARTR